MSQKKRPALGPRNSPTASPRGNVANLIPWKPGQSGNPGGVPRAASEVALLARQYSVGAVEKLNAMMLAPKTKVRDAAYCAMLILSWGIGRPKQEVRLKVDEEAAASQRPEITDPKQRMREIAQALREAGVLDQFTNAEVVDVVEPANGSAGQKDGEGEVVEAASAGTPGAPDA